LKPFIEHETPTTTVCAERPAFGSRAALELYQARSEVECTFNLLKQARRFATRYEKTLRNYAAVVAIGCAMLWLRI
jgi:transposase